MPTWNRGKGAAFLWLMEHKTFAGDECLIWPFSGNQKGYGQLGYNGKLFKAHRFMCEQVHGAPPSLEHEACHSCGKGHDGCVNPRHLSWKTRSENCLDRSRHGRWSPNHYGPRGSLNQQQRLEVLALKGRKTQAEIGKMYGVHEDTVGRLHRLSEQY